MIESLIGRFELEPPFSPWDVFEVVCWPRLGLIVVPLPVIVVIEDPKRLDGAASNAADVVGCRQHEA